jgi:hypothetical protein
LGLRNYAFYGQTRRTYRCPQETMVELRGLLNQAASHLETLRRAGAGSAA